MAENMTANNSNQSKAQTLNPTGLSGDDPVEGRRDIGGTNQNDPQTGQSASSDMATVQHGTAQPKVAPANLQGQRATDKQ